MPTNHENTSSAFSMNDIPLSNVVVKGQRAFRVLTARRAALLLLLLLLLPLLHTACASAKERHESAVQAHLSQQMAKVLASAGRSQQLPQGQLDGCFSTAMSLASRCGTTRGRTLASCVSRGDSCTIMFSDGGSATLARQETTQVPPEVAMMLADQPKDSTALYTGQLHDGTPLQLIARLTADRSFCGSVTLRQSSGSLLHGYLLTPSSIRERTTRDSVATSLGVPGFVSGYVDLPYFADQKLTSDELIQKFEDMAIKRYAERGLYLLDIVQISVSPLAPGGVLIDTPQFSAPLEIDLYFPHGSSGLATLHYINPHYYASPRQEESDNNILRLRMRFIADIFHRHQNHVHPTVDDSLRNTFYAFVYSRSVTATGRLRTNQDVYVDTMEPIVRGAVRKMAIQLMQALLESKR